MPVRRGQHRRQSRNYGHRHHQNQVNPGAVRGFHRPPPRAIGRGGQRGGARIRPQQVPPPRFVRQQPTRLTERHQVVTSGERRHVMWHPGPPLVNLNGRPPIDVIVIDDDDDDDDNKAAPTPSSDNDQSVVLLGANPCVQPDTLRHFATSQQSQPVFEHFTLPHRWLDYHEQNRVPRAIVIDGPNVARSFGTRNDSFSCAALFIMYDYFSRIGHSNIRIFVPSAVLDDDYKSCPVSDRKYLDLLVSKDVIARAPYRRYPDGRIVQCYDDRFILEYAYREDAIVVSNDSFRDIVNENARFRHVVKNRLLVFTFVTGKLMFPSDPAGRNGPGLLAYLSKSKNCEDDEVKKKALRKFREERRKQQQQQQQRNHYQHTIPAGQYQTPRNQKRNLHFYKRSVKKSIERSVNRRRPNRKRYNYAMIRFNNSRRYPPNMDSTSLLWRF